MQDYLNEIKWNDQGLVAAIAEDVESGKTLMLAWMNAQALQETIETKQAVYYSRSRACLWRKGEQSGHTQEVQEIRLDCDGDAVILKVIQHGGIACHTGRQSCFYRVYNEGGWVAVDEVIKDPSEIYR